MSILLNRDTTLDFGPHTIESLLERKVDPNAIRTVFISHMHLDHFAGLTELIWYRAIFNNATDPLIVVGPRGIEKITRDLIRLYHTPEPFEINVEFREERYENATGFPMNHLIRDIGYRIEFPEATIFYSGDTAYCENAVKGAENSDFLFHECTYLDDRRSDAEFWKHSTLSDALSVKSESHSKRFVPVHLTPPTETRARNLSRKDPSIVFPLRPITIV